MTYTPPTMKLSEAAAEVAKIARYSDFHKTAEIAGRVAVGGGNDKERDLIGRLAAEWEIATLATTEAAK